MACFLCRVFCFVSVLFLISLVLFCFVSFFLFFWFGLFCVVAVQTWKSKLREIIDGMRLAFIKTTMHDEAYATILERARSSFESGQLHALYEKNSRELQPLKSGFACFKCARSFSRMETSKVHCRSCGRLFCGTYGRYRYRYGRQFGLCTFFFFFFFFFFLKYCSCVFCMRRDRCMVLVRQ